ncbi:MAG: hypothetical protein QM831_12775 [Kofleriaceae bacterium]
MICSCFCTPNCPAANPYRSELTYTTIALIVVAIAWRILRPQPRYVLRWYVGVGSTLALGTVLAQTFMDFSEGELRVSCRFIVEAACFVTASLAGEILLSPRRSTALARATARK